MGFDDVFEVAKAAELCSAYSREYLIKNSVEKACHKLGVSCYRETYRHEISISLR